MPVVAVPEVGAALAAQQPRPAQEEAERPHVEVGAALAAEQPSASNTTTLRRRLVAPAAVYSTRELSFRSYPHALHLHRERSR
jgi:hypothetical protein